GWCHFILFTLGKPDRLLAGFAMSVVRVSPSDFSSRTSARTALAPDNLETSRVLVAQQGWIPGCLLPKTSIDWLYNRIPTQSERELF
ncbi:MAG: hypothetical protein WCI11_14610, partial [Candidatus Methylumidiphilus sp.]